MPTTRIIDIDVQPLPSARLRVLQLLPKADVELGELVSLVETDPALTMGMIRLANSASSSPGRRIGTARAAVIRAGALVTKRAMAGTVLNHAFPEVGSAAIGVEEYWRHSVAIALLADQIAIRQGGRTEAFTAGLLHDIGCLAMAASEPERYRRVVQLVKQGVPEVDAERVMFGNDHSQYGMQIAERWDLSPMIVEAVGDHHGGNANDVASATAHAREVARHAGIGDGRGVAPSGETHLDAGDRRLLHSMRGIEGLNAQISSFQDAMGVRPRPVTGGPLDADPATDTDASD